MHVNTPAHARVYQKNIHTPRADGDFDIARDALPFNGDFQLHNGHATTLSVSIIPSNDSTAPHPVASNLQDSEIIECPIWCVAITQKEHSARVCVCVCRVVS
jgi:hypothetical protein